jgi:hypothetical protein
MYGKRRRIKDNLQNLRHKILIIGDSHARGMAAKLRHSLEDQYSVQGLVKPGADLAAVLTSGVKDIKGFSKRDMVIVWGGTIDVSRNETEKGLFQIRSFVRENSHTNVLVMNLPNRLDLEATSCVNQEIKVFNRKLCKHFKVFDCVSTIEVTFERGHYTRHGLHLNTKGKDHSVTLLSSAIKNTFTISKVTPITMTWTEMYEVPSTENLGMIGEQMGDSSDSVNRQAETLQHEVSNIRVSGRERKIPVTRTNDFLW